MGVSWAFVVLLVWPALQLPLLWVVVRYFGLRNDDGPDDPVGYSLAAGGSARGDRTSRRGPTGRDERARGLCVHCGRQNESFARYCERCLSVLGTR